MDLREEKQELNESWEHEESHRQHVPYINRTDDEKKEMVDDYEVKSDEPPEDPKPGDKNFNPIITDVSEEFLKLVLPKGHTEAQLINFHINQLYHNQRDIINEITLIKRQILNVESYVAKNIEKEVQKFGNNKWI